MNKKRSIKLRRACRDDAEFLWHLLNDPEVRKASFSTVQVSWDEHLRWLESKLNDPLCFFFIAFQDDKTSIGQVRFDVTDADSTISISIAKKFRGKGYGTKIIGLSAKKLFELRGISRIHAYVKPNNKASVSAFLKASFKDIGATIVNNHEAIHLLLIREIQNEALY